MPSACRPKQSFSDVALLTPLKARAGFGRLPGSPLLLGNGDPWCAQREGFRDFTLGQIGAALPTELAAAQKREQDAKWNRVVEFAL